MKFWLLLFFCVSLSAETNLPNAFYSRFNEGVDIFGRDRNLDRPTPKFEDLRKILKSVKSRNEFLKALSEDPALLPLLQNFTLVFASESEERQEVSEQNPRILMHLDRLIVAVTQGGVQVIDFHPVKEGRYQEGEFSFHVKRFSKPEIEDDPKRCSRCHGTSPRPRWASYPFWPGVYGSPDDSILDREFLDKKGLKNAKESIEARSWKKFVGSLEKSDFRYLVFPEQRFPPLSDPERSRRVGLPNTHLGNTLSLLNTLSIWSELKRTPQYHQYLPAYVGVFSKCESIEKFLPLDLQKKHRDKILERRPDLGGKSMDVAALLMSLELDVKKVNLEDVRARLTRSEILSGKLPLEETETYLMLVSENDAKEIAELRFLVEGQGISMQGWSMNFRPRKFTYDFWNGLKGIYHLKPLFENDLKTEAVCETLAVQSRKAF